MVFEFSGDGLICSNHARVFGAWEQRMAAAEHHVAANVRRRRILNFTFWIQTHLHSCSQLTCWRKAKSYIHHLHSQRSLTAYIETTSDAKNGQRSIIIVCCLKSLKTLKWNYFIIAAIKLLCMHLESFGCIGILQKQSEHNRSSCSSKFVVQQNCCRHSCRFMTVYDQCWVRQAFFFVTVTYCHAGKLQARLLLAGVPWDQSKMDEVRWGVKK